MPTLEARWPRFSLRGLFVILAIAWLISMVVVQRFHIVELESEVSGLRSSAIVLHTERAGMQLLIDTWQHEAVEWRVKNGLDPDQPLAVPAAAR